MTENESISELKSKVTDLESQMQQISKILTLLQSENLELRKIIFARNESPNGKRPGSILGLDCPSTKKLKLNIDLITPGVKNQENRAFSDGKIDSSNRRRVMKDIVKDFHSNVLPRYRDHIDNERNSVPRLRGNDGRIILKNIRYIR